MQAGSLVAAPTAPAALAPAGERDLHSPRLRVLVGYDGRPASRDALSFAKALAATRGADLTVASIRAYWPELLGESFELVVREDQHWVRRGAGEVLGEIPFSVRVLAGGHDVAGLREIAQAEATDLIVVGSTHRGRAGHVCPGSVGERILSEAECAVAVVPRGLADRRFGFGTIAVGIDGGEQGQKALCTAIDLAERTGASLRILAAADAEFVLSGEHAPPSADERERVGGILERAVAQARRTVEAEGQLLHGVPSHVIPEAAEGADLLVVGSRDQPGTGHRILLGSVAARLLRTAPCPTLITAAV